MRPLMEEFSALNRQQEDQKEEKGEKKKEKEEFEEEGASRAAIAALDDGKSGVIDDEWYGVSRNGSYSKVGKSGFSWWDAAGNEKKDCGPMYKSIHYWMSYEKKQGGRKYYFGPGDLAIFSSSPGATEEVEVCCAVVKNGRSPMVLGKPNEDGQPGALGEYEMGGFVGLRKPDSRKELVEWEAMLHEYLEKERSRIDAKKVAASDHNGGEDGNHSGQSRDVLDSDNPAFLDAWKPKDMKRKSPHHFAKRWLRGTRCNVG